METTLPQQQNLAAMLFSDAPAFLEVPTSAWGFGGLHGGLALSLVASSLQRGVPDRALRSITGQFHRPIRETFAIETEVIRAGRTVTALRATGHSATNTCLTATAMLGPDQPSVVPTYAPEPPDVPGPHLLPDLGDIDIKVPVLSQVQVRPVGSVQPYAHADDPVMTAWMRVKHRDAPVSPCSVIFFLDALPPSYTATLIQTRPVPTLEFSAHLTSHAPTSPWVLVRSRTSRASEGGWVTEFADAWDPTGTHLGSAKQLRLALALDEG